MSSGTKTSSRATSLKWCEPSRYGIGEIVTPSACRSTISWERPACFLPSSIGDVRQRTAKKWFTCASLVHTLVPVTVQPPSTFVARVRTEARSEPESGSLMPREK